MSGNTEGEEQQPAYAKLTNNFEDDSIVPTWNDFLGCNSTDRQESKDKCNKVDQIYTQQLPFADAPGLNNDQLIKEYGITTKSLDTLRYRRCGIIGTDIRKESKDNDEVESRQWAVAFKKEADGKQPNYQMLGHGQEPRPCIQDQEANAPLTTMTMEFQATLFKAKVKIPKKGDEDERDDPWGTNDIPTKIDDNNRNNVSLVSYYRSDMYNVVSKTIKNIIDENSNMKNEERIKRLEAALDKGIKEYANLKRNPSVQQSDYIEEFEKNAEFNVPDTSNSNQTKFDKMLNDELRAIVNDILDTDLTENLGEDEHGEKPNFAKMKKLKNNILFFKNHRVEEMKFESEAQKALRTNDSKEKFKKNAMRNSEHAFITYVQNKQRAEEAEVARAVHAADKFLEINPIVVAKEVVANRIEKVKANIKKTIAEGRDNSIEGQTDDKNIYQINYQNTCNHMLKYYSANQFVSETCTNAKKQNLDGMLEIVDKVTIARGLEKSSVETILAQCGEPILKKVCGEHKKSKYSVLKIAERYCKPHVNVLFGDCNHVEFPLIKNNLQENAGDGDGDKSVTKSFDEEKETLIKEMTNAIYDSGNNLATNGFKFRGTVKKTKEGAKIAPKTSSASSIEVNMFLAGFLFLAFILN